MHEQFLGQIEDFRRAVDYELTEERLWRVQGATVAYCDAERIRKDFPWVEKGAEEEWLLASGGLISKENQKENAANAEIPIGSTTVEAYRPPRYGRAAIVDSALNLNWQVAGPSHKLVEVKGCGVAPDQTPKIASNKNGLLTMPDAFKELINARLLDRLFKQSNTDVACIPLYGIVNLNISTGVEYASYMPCCTLVRASHIRPPENLEVPLAGSQEEQIKHRIEETLRRFGITSALSMYAFEIFIEDGVPQGVFAGEPVTWGEPEFFIELLDDLEMVAPQTFRFTNVQMAQDCSLVPLSATLVDLSHYIYEPSFDDHVLVTAVSDRPFNIGLLEKDGFDHHAAGSALNANVMLPQQMPEQMIAFYRCLKSDQRARGVDRLAHDLAMEIEITGLNSTEIDDLISQFLSNAFEYSAASLEQVAS